MSSEEPAQYILNFSQVIEKKETHDDDNTTTTTMTEKSITEVKNQLKEKCNRCGCSILECTYISNEQHKNHVLPNLLTAENTTLSEIEKMIDVFSQYIDYQSINMTYFSTKFEQYIERIISSYSMGEIEKLDRIIRPFEMRPKIVKIIRAMYVLFPDIRFVSIIISAFTEKITDDEFIVDPYIMAIVLVPNGYIRTYWFELKYVVFANPHLLDEDREKLQKVMERIRNFQSYEFEPPFLPRDTSFFSTLGYRTEIFLKTDQCFNNFAILMAIFKQSLELWLTTEKCCGIFTDLSDIMQQRRIRNMMQNLDDIWDSPYFKNMSMIMKQFQRVFLFCDSLNFIANLIFENTAMDIFRTSPIINYSGKRITLEKEIYRYTSKMVGKSVRSSKMTVIDYFHANVDEVSNLTKPGQVGRILDIYNFTNYLFILAYDQSRISDRIYNRFRYIDDGTLILANTTRYYQITIPYGNTLEFNFNELKKWASYNEYVNVIPIEQRRLLDIEFANAARKIEKYELNTLIAVMKWVNYIFETGTSHSPGIFDNYDFESATQFLTIPIIIGNYPDTFSHLHTTMPKQTILNITVYNPFYEHILLPMRDLKTIHTQPAKYKYLYFLTFANNNFFKWLLTNQIITIEQFDAIMTTELIVDESGALGTIIDPAFSSIVTSINKCNEAALIFATLVRINMHIAKRINRELLHFVQNEQVLKSYLYLDSNMCVRDIHIIMQFANFEAKTILFNTYDIGSFEDLTPIMLRSVKKRITCLNTSDRLKRLNTLKPNHIEQDHYFYKKYIVLSSVIFEDGTHVIPEVDAHKKVRSTTHIDVISCYTFVYSLLQIFNRMTEFVTEDGQFTGGHYKSGQIYSIIDELIDNKQHILKCEAPLRQTVETYYNIPSGYSPVEKYIKMIITDATYKMEKSHQLEVDKSQQFKYKIDCKFFQNLFIHAPFCKDTLGKIIDRTYNMTTLLTDAEIDTLLEPEYYDEDDEGPSINDYLRKISELGLFADLPAPKTEEITPEPGTQIA